MGEISIDPKFNIHETYKKVRILNPYRNSGATIEPNLFAYYKFNNSAIEEISGYNGVENNISYDIGKEGSAAFFNRAGSYLEVPDSNEFTFSDGTNDKEFSITMFVNFSNQISSQWLVNKRDNLATSNEWSIDYFQGKLRMLLINPTGGFIRKESAFMPTIGQWYHLAYTYDGSKLATGMNIYIDAININAISNPSGTYTGMGNTNSKITIGDKGYSKGDGFLGFMDELRFFNKELSSLRVLDDKNRITA